MGCLPTGARARRIKDHGIEGPKFLAGKWPALQIPYLNLNPAAAGLVAGIDQGLDLGFRAFHRQNYDAGFHGEAEGADVAVFAGNRRGIIYVQGERVANVPEEEILDSLLDACTDFQQRVRNGDAQIGDKTVKIVPPDPIGELGSGVEKIQAGQVEQITISAKR